MEKSRRTDDYGLHDRIIQNYGEIVYSKINLIRLMKHCTIKSEERYWDDLSSVPFLHLNRSCD